MGCIATQEDKVKPLWKVNKQARVLYAVGEAKSRRRDEPYKNRYDRAYLDWRDLNPDEQRKWTDKANGTTRSEGANGHMAVVSSEMPDDASNKTWCYSPGMLFTFNGSWLLDDEEYLSVVKKWKDMPHILERCVKDVPSVQSLFAEFSKLVQEVVQVYRCRKRTACLELSLKAEELGRLHFHCFLERNCREDNAWAKWSRIAERLDIREWVCLILHLVQSRAEAGTEIGH